MHRENLTQDTRQHDIRQMPLEGARRFSKQLRYGWIYIHSF